MEVAAQLSMYFLGVKLVIWKNIENVEYFEYQLIVIKFSPKMIALCLTI